MGYLNERQAFLSPIWSLGNFHLPVRPIIRQLPTVEGEGYHMLPSRHALPTKLLMLHHSSAFHSQKESAESLPSSTYMTSQTHIIN